MRAPSPQLAPAAMPGAWDLVAAAYTRDNLPVFEGFARDALDLARLPVGARVADVASGPGTLALIAAKELEARASALDFAPLMIEHLRARAGAMGVEVDAREGDGVALPWPDRSFDAAFSMFGLMFFPDRARGFAELLRVLVPGGRAVVSSWVPMSRVPVLAAFFEALVAEVPDLPPRGPTPPLGDPDSCLAEMSSAGFTDVTVHERSQSFEVPSVRAFVESTKRTNVNFVVLGQKLGPTAFAELAERIYDRLAARLGPGPLRVEMPALLTVGARP